MKITSIANAFVAATVVAASLVAGNAIAVAQETYPKNPIRLVVPYPAGGSVDFVGRIVANKLNEKLNQTIVVDNRGGANGLIGSNNIAKSEPDGYSLLLGSVGPLAINPSLYSNVPYNAVTDFASVSLVAQVPLVLLVNPQLGVNSMAELIARAKTKPGSMTYGSAGNGSTQHLAMEMFKSMSGTDIQHIPYKGEAPSVVDLLAGRIDIMIALLPPIYSQIEAGKLKPLAVSTLKRVAALPDVPTADEQGLKGFEVVSWMGLFAPAGTPKPIVDKLNSALASFPDDADVKDKFDRVGGVIPMKSTPEELHNVLKTDIEKWAKIVKAANVSMN